MFASGKVLLSFALFCAFISTAYSIECYVCHYDVAYPDILNGNDNCISEPFDSTGVNIESDAEKCYKAAAYEDDDLVSVHRGKGSATISGFITSVSRDEDDFSVNYCVTDLCNSATSLAIPTVLLTSTLLAVVVKYL